MVDLVVENIAELVTLAGPAGPRTGADMGTVHAIADGAVAIADGRVVLAGKRSEVLASVRPKRTVDALGAVVVPGFVDPHTHAVYAHSRHDEWGERLAGATYTEIAARGGGIRSSVRHMRAATADELVATTRRRLDRMMAMGTTSLEIKSGYGLELAAERKSLEVIAKLDREHAMTLVPTFLGAHEIPDEYRNDRRAYIDLVINDMLPVLAPLAKFCDVFCEDHVFTVDESREILQAGQRHGLGAKLHADELEATGGAELAAELGAVSADHLVACSAEGIARMAAAGVVAVLLPGTTYFLQLERRAPARAMIAAGLPVALATDCNPGSCPSESMPMMMSLACQQLGMTPAEALVASTVNSAYAVGLGDVCGTLEPGKWADLLLIDADSWQALPYHFGTNLVRQTVKRGQVCST